MSGQFPGHFASREGGGHYRGGVTDFDNLGKTSYRGQEAVFPLWRRQSIETIPGQRTPDTYRRAQTVTTDEEKGCRRLLRGGGGALLGITGRWTPAGPGAFGGHLFMMGNFITFRKQM